MSDLLKNNLKKIWQKIASAWNFWYRVVFFFLLAGFMLAGIYLWYGKIHAFKWSEEEKNEYVQTKMRVVNLKEDKFEKLLRIVENKKTMFEKTNPAARDIFN